MQYLLRLVPFRCRSCGSWLRRNTVQPVAGQCCVCYGFDNPREVTMGQAGEAKPRGWDGPPGTLTSPWVWTAADANGASITISVDFNASTRALQGATVVRNTGCLYRTILIGLGTDGTPDTAANAFPVPYGTSSLTARQLTRNGLATIDDVLALQITAGF